VLFSHTKSASATSRSIFLSKQINTGHQPQSSEHIV